MLTASWWPWYEFELLGGCRRGPSVRCRRWMAVFSRSAGARIAEVGDRPRYRGVRAPGIRGQRDAVAAHPRPGRGATPGSGSRGCGDAGCSRPPRRICGSSTGSSSGECGRPHPRWTHREAHRIPVLRSLPGRARLAACAPRPMPLLQTVELAVAAEEAGRGRRVRAGAPLRPSARVAVPAARRDRRAHEPHRHRYRRHRHALREPALHGRGCGGRRPHRRRPAAARRQPWITRDRAARIRRRSATCPATSRADADLARRKTEVFRAAIAGAAVVEADPKMGPAGYLAIEPQSPGLADRIWWGAGTRADSGVGGRAGHEPDELDAADRGHRRAVPRAAGRADRHVSRCLGEGRPRARAARLGEPQYLPARHRRGPPLLRHPARRPIRRTRSATSTAASRGSARATSASRMRWQRSLREDTAVQAADTLMVTIPNQLGVDYNAKLLESIVEVRQAGARLTGYPEPQAEVDDDDPSGERAAPARARGRASSHRTSR